MARSPCLFERVTRRIERLHRPVEVARDERDLGLGDGASRAGDGLPRAEGAGRATQQQLGAREIAELRHRDAAKRQRRRIVAQSNMVQRAKGIARCERAGRRCNQGVHSNPDTLVTPTSSVPGTKCLFVTDKHSQYRAAIGKPKEGEKR